MNEYIFYTTEGSTTAPNMDVEVENCQVLGRAYGETPQEARAALMGENSWIKDCGFDIEEAIYKQIVTEDLQTEIRRKDDIIEYLVDSLDDKQLNDFKNWLSLKNL